MFASVCSTSLWLSFCFVVPCFVFVFLLLFFFKADLEFTLVSLLSQTRTLVTFIVFSGLNTCSVVNV